MRHPRLGTPIARPSVPQNETNRSLGWGRCGNAAACAALVSESFITDSDKAVTESISFGPSVPFKPHTYPGPYAPCGREGSASPDTSDNLLGS